MQKDVKKKKKTRAYLARPRLQILFDFEV